MCSSSKCDVLGVCVIGRLNHVAIAVKDVCAAAVIYRDLGADVSVPVALPDHGVSVVFVTLSNAKIELIEPLGEASPIADFVAKRPQGAIHHICYEVDDILRARERLRQSG